VAVIHQLSSLSPRSGKPRAVNRIIQTTLEQKQQVFTCDSLHAGSAFEIVTELSFKDEINALNLLLLAQLLTVADQRLATPH